jgi:hypothetical protein
MATSVGSELGVADLSNVYPTTLGARMAWLEDQLRIHSDRVLKLAGVNLAFPPSRSSIAGWNFLAEIEATRLREAELTLLAFISHFCNDLGKARTFLEQARTDTEFVAKHLPFLTRFDTDKERDAALLGIVREAGADFIFALATFLAPAKHHPAE